MRRRSFLALHAHSLRFQRGLDRHRLHSAQKLPGKSTFDAGAAERQATGLTQHKVRTVATVDPLSWCAAGITDRQPAPATRATEKTGQKRPSAPTRLDAPHPAIRIGGKLLLIPFELSPIDIALVMLFEHDLPFVEGFAMAVGLVSASVDNLSALLAFAVNVSAGIERILQNGDHRAVADRRPVESHHPLSVRGARKMDLIGSHRQQHLSCTPQLAEAGEDEADRFLEPECPASAPVRQN